MAPALFKNKSVGFYLQFAASALAVVALIAYIIFGAASHTFLASIFVCLLIGVAVGVLLVFYRGTFSVYAMVAMAVIMAVSFILLANDSIDDITAMMVGMGDYFGNAENVGPRFAVAVFILLSVILDVVASFMGRTRDNA